MRKGNEEIRNGNDEMRLRVGKLVHASQKLAHWHYIDFLSREIMATVIHCKSYCPYLYYSKPYNKFETEVDY